MTFEHFNTIFHHVRGKHKQYFTFGYCADNFYPWKDIVGKKVSKLMSIAELIGRFTVKSLRTFWPRFWEIWMRSCQNCSLLSQKLIKSCEQRPLPSRNENTTEFGVLWVLKHEPRPSAAWLSSGSLADFLARKDLADFLLEALARISRRQFQVICE